MKTRKRITRHTVFILLSLPLWVCTSCREGTSGGINIFSPGFVDEEHFLSLIHQKLQPVDTSDSLFRYHLLSDPNANVAYAYQLAQYRPLWFDGKGIMSAAKDFREQIGSLGDEGLTCDYNTTYLDNILKWSSGKDIPADSIVLWDEAFTRSYLSIARDLLLGEGVQAGEDPEWFAANDSLFDGASYLVQTLRSSKQLPSLDHFRPEEKAYTQMREAVHIWKSLLRDSAYISAKQLFAEKKNTELALQIIGREIPGLAMPAPDSTGKDWPAMIKAYQYYHQLAQTGKLDSNTIVRLAAQPEAYVSKLQLNMTRLRRLPKNTPGEYVWVNIPLMELSYVKDKDRRFHARVVVGKTTRQTPSLLARMTNIVFNPPWGVPPTILKNDVGPGVSRSGSGYLARKGLRAYDAQGRDVTASVNGANYRRFSYRQPPGAHNSLGEIKFNLPNKWDIYIHDTPHKENFSSRMRALSSGCVRVQYPKDFAAAMLDDRNYTMGKIDSTIETRKTRLEKLNRTVEVYIVYLTVAPDSTGNHLRYLQDIYKRDNHFFSPDKLSALK